MSDTSTNFQVLILAFLLAGIDLHEINGLLEFADELSEVLGIDYNALTDIAAFVSGSLAFDDIEEHVPLVILLNIEEIGSVIGDEPG